MYKIEYLPIAMRDLEKIIAYIAGELSNPVAANTLLDDLNESVSKLAEFPLAFKVYRPIVHLETEYRVLPVKRYLVFYTIHENKQSVEVHRILYAKMNVDKLLHQA